MISSVINWPDIKMAALHDVQTFHTRVCGEAGPVAAIRPRDGTAVTSEGPHHRCAVVKAKADAASRERPTCVEEMPREKAPRVHGIRR